MTPSIIGVVANQDAIPLVRPALFPGESDEIPQSPKKGLHPSVLSNLSNKFQSFPEARPLMETKATATEEQSQELLILRDLGSSSLAISFNATSYVEILTLV
jgi:hypothetical protein